MKIRLAELRRIIRTLLEDKKPNAGPFHVGDDVKWGKYKNKSAKIKRVFNDEKDHVAVELEPHPKGRKKNVEIGLYKIWKDDEADDLDEVDADPSNNPGRPADAFEYLGMHPSPTAAMAHPAAAGSGGASGGEAASSAQGEGGDVPPGEPTEGS